MLLNSVILVLREVLEAALLICAMLSFSYRLKISRSWLKWSIVMGLLGAILYAHNIIIISNSFEGVGQEVLNAAMQYLIYLLLAAFCILLIQGQPFSAQYFTLIYWIMGMIISLSMIREFSEILIYLQVFSIDSLQFMPVAIGAFLGAGIGLSIGIIFYHLLNYFSEKGSFNPIVIMLGFIAAGMVSQATQSLIQADWLSIEHPIWDSTSWIPERSVVGQLLSAVFGYEATPSLIQVELYFASLFIILFFVLKQAWINRS